MALEGVYSTQPSAQCIPINLEDLTFCSMVNYDACMRVPAPGVYDDAVSDAYSLRMNYWKNEQSKFYNKGCEDVFKAYFCHLSYPQCLKYEEVDADAAKSNAKEGQFVELPLCWDYCFSTAQICIGDKEMAEKDSQTMTEEEMKELREKAKKMKDPVVPLRTKVYGEVDAGDCYSVWITEILEE